MNLKKMYEKSKLQEQENLVDEFFTLQEEQETEKFIEEYVSNHRIRLFEKIYQKCHLREITTKQFCNVLLQKIKNFNNIQGLNDEKIKNKLNILMGELSTIIESYLNYENDEGLEFPKKLGRDYFFIKCNMINGKIDPIPRDRIQKFILESLDELLKNDDIKKLTNNYLYDFLIRTKIDLQWEQENIVYRIFRYAEGFMKHFKNKAISNKELFCEKIIQGIKPNLVGNPIQKN